MNTDSVKAKLKNFAEENGITFQEALIYYGLERTIYRISVSNYSDHFVLKGGIFLYAIYDRKYERVTTDIDLLARRISNSSIYRRFHKRSYAPKPLEILSEKEKSTCRCIISRSHLQNKDLFNPTY